MSVDLTPEKYSVRGYGHRTLENFELPHFQDLGQLHQENTQGKNLPLIKEAPPEEEHGSHPAVKTGET